MDEVILWGGIIFGVVLLILVYIIKKLEKRIAMLEYNNDSFMEILYLLQNGNKIEKIVRGDEFTDGEN